MKKPTKSGYVALMLLVLLGGCASTWEPVDPDQKIYTMLDIPLLEFNQHPEQYLGTVLEDRFKFYHIYHDKETYNPAEREQVIEGKTHFTSRPIRQYGHVIQIQITPQQERWIRKTGIERQDVLKARIRFAGIAPGGALAFDLLEVLEPGERRRP